MKPRGRAGWMRRTGGTSPRGLTPNWWLSWPDGKPNSHEAGPNRASPRLFLPAKAVTDARFGVEQTGAGGVRLDLIPQVGDVDAQGVRIVRVFHPPDPGEQLPMGEDAVGVLGHVLQQLIFGR